MTTPTPPGAEPPGEGRDGLARALLEAGPEELPSLVEEELERIDAGLARQVLRHPYLTLETLRLLIAEERLATDYEWRRDVAAHRLAPQAVAMRFLATLRWTDLARLGRDVSVPPLIRRHAENALCNRLPGLSLGEKITLARSAGDAALRYLRHEPHPRVFEALLQNPRLTVGLLMPVARSTSTASELLGMLASSSKWGVRYDLKLQLCRNPRTPIHNALYLLSGLRRGDLESLARDRTLRTPVKQRAAQLARPPRSGS